jgi:tetratricopeptide (TPR) repeat protein
VLAADGLGVFYSATGRWQEGEATFQRTAEELQVLHGLTPTAAIAARLLVKSVTWQALLTWIPFTHFYDEHLEHLLRHGLALLAHPALAEQDTRAEEAFIRRQLGRILRWPASRDQVEEGRRHLETSLRLCRTLDDDVGAADALYELSFYASGPPERAREFLRESLALQQPTGDPRRMARTLVELGNVSRPLLAYDEAKEMFEQAYITSQAAGQLHGMVDARSSAIFLAWFLGEFDRALNYAEEAAALSSQTGDPRLVALSLVNAGLSHAYHGRFSRAMALIQEGVAMDQYFDSALSKCWLALAHIHAGRYQAGSALAQMINPEDIDKGWAERLLGWVAMARDDYSVALPLTQRAVTRSRKYLAWRAEQSAWSQVPLGLALYRLGRQAEAQRELCDALQTFVRIRAFLPLMHLMAVIPVLLADEDEDELKERAVELYALAESLPFIANSQLFADIAGKHIAAVAATLAPDVVLAVQARGRALDWWETAEGLLEELRALGWGGSPS